MSDNAALLLTQKYKNQIMMQAQTTTSELERAVMSGPTDGERTRHQLFGKTVPVERVARNQDTPITPTPYDDRWSVTRNFWAADLYDKFDKVRSAVDDPTQAYAKSQVYGMNRLKDQLLQAAIRGTAITGQTGTGTQTLPAAQKVTVNSHTFDEANPSGSTNAGLTYYKVIEAVKVLKAQWGGGIAGKIHGYMYAQEEATLIATTKTSASYYIPEQLKPFATGEIRTLLGVQWHLLPDDDVVLDGSSNRLVHLWLPDAVYLDVNEDGVNTNIVQRWDKMGAWQISAEMFFAAVRGDDKGVAEIACHPTTLF